MHFKTSSNIANSINCENQFMVILYFTCSFLIAMFVLGMNCIMAVCLS